MNWRKRLSKIEQRVPAGPDAEIKKAIYFVVESARLDAVPETGPIVEWTHHGKAWTLQPGETQESFADRAAREAKQRLKHPMAVPVLIGSYHRTTI